MQLLYILNRYETNKYGCVINKKLLVDILLHLLTIDNKYPFATQNTH